MRKINILFVIVAILMVTGVVLDVISKNWANVFTGSIWVINLFVCAFFYNKAYNLYEAAQFFIERIKEMEDCDESQN